jgi:hypothetical protein
MNHKTLDWVNKIIKKFPDNVNKFDYSKVEYKNRKTKVCIICKICGEEFWQRADNHLYGCGCPHCAMIKSSNYIDREILKKSFLTKSEIVHQKDYDYSKIEYINSYTKVCIIHKKCGKEFYQTAHHHLIGHGCPYCKASKLENSVEKILTEKNIFFIKNFREFDWLKNKYPLELDFYLPEHNIGIECQGIQHFKPIEHWGGEDMLIYLQNNDNIKAMMS